MIAPWKESYDEPCQDIKKYITLLTNVQAMVFSNSQVWMWELDHKEGCYAMLCLVTSVVSDSVWPHRRQPTRLPHPWDSPGKNPGVGCHFLLQCMKVKRESEVTQSCPTLSNPMDCSLPGSSICGIFQARVGCHCLLQKKKAQHQGIDAGKDSWESLGPQRDQTSQS